jgi:hypothetical protein
VNIVTVSITTILKKAIVCRMMPYVILRWTWVDAHHSGWENNDGGSGTVTIHVAENNFQLEHTEYYTESSSYEYTL